MPTPTRTPTPTPKPRSVPAERELPGATSAAGDPARPVGSDGGPWPNEIQRRSPMTLSDLDARILVATDTGRERTPDRVAELAGCQPDVALSCLRRLRTWYLVEDDQRKPARWLRTHHGDRQLKLLP